MATDDVPYRIFHHLLCIRTFYSYFFLCHYYIIVVINPTLSLVPLCHYIIWPEFWCGSSISCMHRRSASVASLYFVRDAAACYAPTRGRDQNSFSAQVSEMRMEVIPAQWPHLQPSSVRSARLPKVVTFRIDYARIIICTEFKWPTTLGCRMSCIFMKNSEETRTKQKAQKQ